jgi:hypothetical protein
MNPIYPVYVISKGRYKVRLTIRSLEAMQVPHWVVVEPQEAELYARAGVPEARLLTLPFSNLGLGSIPARNWVWDHSVINGDKRHWIIDDNINGFYRLLRNLKIPAGDGTFFRAMEMWADRFEDMALVGPQYAMFATRRKKWPAYVLNTRVYSCILIRNDLVDRTQGDRPMRWRGRYNEDTDLSLRAMKSGYCTALFNAFLAAKMQTLTMKGGNTDTVYAEEDARLKMAESLVEQHPDVTTIYFRWGRWQHLVNYKPFKGMRPQRVDASLDPLRSGPIVEKVLRVKDRALMVDEQVEIAEEDLDKIHALDKPKRPRKARRLPAEPAVVAPEVSWTKWL